MHSSHSDRCAKRTKKFQQVHSSHIYHFLFDSAPCPAWGGREQTMARCPCMPEHLRPVWGCLLPRTWQEQSIAFFFAQFVKSKGFVAVLNNGLTNFQNGWPFAVAAHFSGTCEIATRGDTFNRIDDRVVHRDRTKTVRLAFCQDEGAWGFSPINETDRCNCMVAKSSKTAAFDVLEEEDNQWHVKNSKTCSHVPVDWLASDCVDCGENSGSCSRLGGTCEDRVCTCNPGRMGIHCQHADPQCQDLGVDERTCKCAWH